MWPQKNEARTQSGQLIQRALGRVVCVLTPLAMRSERLHRPSRNWSPLQRDGDPWPRGKQACDPGLIPTKLNRQERAFNYNKLIEHIAIAHELTTDGGAAKSHATEAKSQQAC